jgi:sulfur-oxidizing protein SoxZ
LFNGQLVTKMIIWEALSTNPLFTTNFKVPGPGEMKVIFTDNKGTVTEKSKKIKPKG